MLIGKCCLPLRVEALKAAVIEAKSGSDVTRYKDAWALLRSAAPDEPEAQRDEVWIENAEIANRTETARLETELKGYRNNLIKESIRVGKTPPQIIYVTAIYGDSWYLTRLLPFRWATKISASISRV
jgi:hypothetical protein